MGSTHAAASWLFFVGVAIVVFGIYLLFFNPLAAPPESATPQSFMIMLVGLMVTGFGAVYGRNRLRVAEPASMQPEPMKQTPWEARQEPKPEPQQSQPVLQPQPIQQFQAQPAESVHYNPTEILKQAEPAKVVRVLLCPRCGKENEEKNTFCSDCGKKLRSTSK